MIRDVQEQTCSFFHHPINKMSIPDWVSISGLKCNLQTFQTLEVYYIFVVEVSTISVGILADNIGLKNIKSLLFHI